MRVWAIVVAGGRGDRFGRPKQFESLDGTRLIDWAVTTAQSCCDGVVAVVPGGGEVPGATTVAGGDTRAASVRAGLAAVPAETDVVVVHDAARPLAPAALFAAVVDEVRRGADGAVPGLPVVDTIKEVAGRTVVATLDRAKLVTVQTPQAFRATVLRRAHEGNGDATDDAALVESLGGTIVVVPGDPMAAKVTTPADLAALRGMLADG